MNSAACGRALAFGLILGLFSQTVLAQRSGIREHDGFYARLGSGFSGYSDTLISEDRADSGDPAEATQTGVATVSELALGGTVAPGIVLGGGLYTADLLAWNTTVERDQLLPPEFDRPSNLVLLAVLVDWYFSPDAGLHAQAGLGFALLAGMEPDRSGIHYRTPAPGGGLMLGAGQEWFVGEQWSMGVLARATVAVLADEDDSGLNWLHVAGASPSLLLSATYH